MERGLGRRTVIGGLAAAPVAAAEAAVVLPSAAAPDALAAWLDTLIPADETPGAVTLGFTEADLAHGPNAASMSRLLRAGFAWLDGEARKHGKRSFAELPAVLREAIAQAAEAAPAPSLPSRFFALTRDRAMELYYARRESWAGLPGYRGPPQPEGYLDHEQAPA